MICIRLACRALRAGIASEDLAHISIATKGLVGGGGTKLLWSPVFGDSQIDFAELFQDPIGLIGLSHCQ